MSITAGLAAFKLAFQLSPIMLTGGMANNMPQSTLPIIALTEAASFVQGLLSGGENIELDNFFAHFQPMPGSSLIDNQIGQYPFANQAVAGNAIIAMPLKLSMLMVIPAKGIVGYAVKLATMMSLQAALNLHNSQGGTYTVITPVYFYTNGILTGMRDVSNPASKQPQNAWQLDFEFPLLTLNQLDSVQGSLMSKISNGSNVGASPAWSNTGVAVGDVNNLASPGLLNVSSGLPGAGTAPASLSSGT